MPASRGADSTAAAITWRNSFVRRAPASRASSAVEGTGVASYPAAWTASSSGASLVPWAAVTRARSVARLTDTSDTPGTRCNARSTRRTHDAQVIPWMAMSSSCPSVGSITRASIARLLASGIGF